MSKEVSPVEKGDNVAPDELQPVAEIGDLATVMWASCMKVAFDNPEIRKSFEKETGLRQASPKTALDRMIDAATGHDTAYAHAFVVWATAAIWGSSWGVPPSLLAEASGGAIGKEHGM